MLIKFALFLHKKNLFCLRILALDIGEKRTGLAHTDSLGMIASGLKTVLTTELIQELKLEYEKEIFEQIVVGEPKQMSGAHSESFEFIQQQVKKISRYFPDLSIHWQDERFSSKLALKSMVDAGVPKKKRQEKGRLDEISATIILQSFLDRSL